MKQYHVYNAQAKQAEAKLKNTEALRLKVEQQASKASKKLKLLDKQREKVCHGCANCVFYIYCVKCKGQGHIIYHVMYAVKTVFPVV